MDSEAKIFPALVAGETYTESDFLLVQTSMDDDGESHTVIDRVFAAKREDDTGRWVCKNITSRTKMSHCAALATAKIYAQENHVPVIYHERDDGREPDSIESKSESDEPGER